MTEAPAQLGFRWPAEWEPHAATWLTWPHNADTWPGKLAAAADAFAAIAAALHVRETVCIALADEPAEARARARLEAAGVDVDAGVRFHRIPTDDGWMRDCGPIFVVRDAKSGVGGQAPRSGARSEPQASGVGGQAPRSGARSEPQASEVACIDFRFDAWGGKYPPWDLDAAVGRAVAEAAGVRCFAADLVLEGGAIDGDGRGTLLTTESCLLNPNRGAGRTREALERALAETLGTRQVLWLAGGIAGDDTDGHVDEVARFVAPGTVVAAVEPDAHDPNCRPLAENLRRLRAQRDADGKPLSVVELPMPRRVTTAGRRSPASYANFFLANGVALVPSFGLPSDARALAILRELLPDREVVGIPCRDLVVGLGGVHCVTQQQPAAPPAH